LIFIAVMFCVGLPTKAKACRLYLESPRKNYSVGEEFVLEIRIDPEEESINALEINLEFDKEVLELKGFEWQDSILPIWIKKPEEIDVENINEEGLISFSGGIPGGFEKKFFDTPIEANLLGKLIFKVKEKTENRNFAIIRFLESSEVLLNDGRGGKADLSTEGMVLSISQQNIEGIEVEEKEDEPLKEFSRLLFLLEIVYNE